MTNSTPIETFQNLTTIPYETQNDLPPQYPSDLNDGRTVIVAAHFDDETLWHLPLLKNAKALVIAAHGLPESGRMLARNNYESGVVLGHELPVYSLFPEQSDSDFIKITADDEKCRTDLVRNSKEEMVARLVPLFEDFKKQGVVRVATHNPWGEYGHPDHKTTEAAVREAAMQVGLDVWEDTVVHTKRTATLEEGGRYLNAAPLFNNANSSNPFDYTANEGMFHQARAGFQNTWLSDHAGHTMDMWTWHDRDDEYPTTNGPERTFIRTVTTDTSGRTRDELGGLDTSDHQKTRGTTPMAQVAHQILGWDPYPDPDAEINGVPAKEYVAPNYYYCDPNDPSKLPAYAADPGEPKMPPHPLPKHPTTRSGPTP